MTGKPARARPNRCGMKDTQKVTLVAFLNARLDEDEAAAKAAASVAGPDWHHELCWPDDGSSGTVMIFSAGGSPLADTLHRDDEEMAPFIARHDPARALREVEAGRGLLARYEDALGITGAEGEDEIGWRLALEYALRLRAAAYSDHPDYRQEWKP